jgi:hypothetical protein
LGHCSHPQIFYTYFYGARYKMYVLHCPTLKLKTGSGFITLSPYTFYRLLFVVLWPGLMPAYYYYYLYDNLYNYLVFY